MAWQQVEKNLVKKNLINTILFAYDFDIIEKKNNLIIDKVFQIHIEYI